MGVTSLVQSPFPYFADELERFGTNIALVAESGETLSYSELATRADAFAAALPSGRQLALLGTANGIATIVAYVGLLRARRPVILSDAASPGRHDLIETFAPQILVSPDGTIDLRLADRPTTLHPELAVMLSTSGTTGATKLVRLSARNIDANARSIADYLELTSDDRAITSLPFHYTYGLSVIHSHLAAGASLLLTDRSVTDPAFVELFDRFVATSIAGVPYTYELLERIGFRERASPSLRTLTQAGGRLPVELVRTYGEWTRARDARFFVMYGQTEATARISYVPPAMLAGNEGTIGVPIPGGEITLERDGIAVTEGEGELVYRGPNVMMGYAESMDDLAHGHDLDSLHTGDLAGRDGQGLFRITGRSSRFSKLFGLRVSHDQVEQIVGEWGVRVAATGTDDFLALCIAGRGDAADIRLRLAERLGLPAGAINVERRDDWPRLPSGKVDYRTIRTDAEFRHQASGDSTSRPLIDLYRDAFPRLKVGEDDSFISLGGDSLVYVLIAAEIEDRLGALPQGWEELSIGELERLAPVAVRRSGIDSELLLRALAIVAVVINHASDFVVGGGAEALLLLCGYNWARFQRQRLSLGTFWRSVGDYCLRIVLPVYLITLAMAAFKEWPGWPSLFLISNFYGRYHTILEPFWFIETLLQSMVVLAVIASLAPVRRLIATRPVTFGWGLLATALAVRWTASMAFPHEHLANRTPDVLFPLIALGWCIYFARGWQRLVVMGAALIVALWSLGWWDAGTIVEPGAVHRMVWPIGATFLLLFVPRIPMPVWPRSALVAVAGASFMIYVAHGLPIWIINEVHGQAWPWTKIVAGVASGFVLQAVMVRILAWTERLRGRRGALTETR